MTQDELLRTIREAADTVKAMSSEERRRYQQAGILSRNLRNNQQA